MVWGCIASNGQCALTFVDGNVNSDKYINILHSTLLPLLEDLPLSMWKKIVFQQDNARPHTARTTIDFLHTHHISVPYWPALSPDINPIENVWAIMKRKVRLKEPTSLESLRNEIEIAWKQTVTPALCHKLYSSMPSRMHNIIRRRGLR
jgi:transposase